MDSYPLPVTGTETKVMTNDIAPYLGSLSEIIGKRRNEGFIGWYHSHPFDVWAETNCHMSNTDIMTQRFNQWGVVEWLGIVVDPLRSLAKQVPELGAYRCYFEKEYKAPKNMAPDGTKVTSIEACTKRWGAGYREYYALEIEYFMSSFGARLLKIMSRNSLWIRTLASAIVLEAENRTKFADRVQDVAKKLASKETASGFGAAFGNGGGGGGGDSKSDAEDDDGGLGRAGSSSSRSGVNQVVKECSDLAIEQSLGQLSQVTKDILFNAVEGGKTK
jgi:COP9 signalosome complex subunit 5